MSFPGPITVPIAIATGVQTSFDTLLSTVSTNPYFIGLMMITMNLGGRFLGMEMSPQQERFFQHPYVRRFLIFTVLFIATRNIWVALWMSIVIILCIGYLFNEKSALCIFSWKGLTGSSCAKKITPGLTGSPMNEGFSGLQLTPLEEEIFQKLLAKRGGGSMARPTQAPKESFSPEKIDAEIENMIPKEILKLYTDNIGLLGANIGK